MLQFKQVTPEAAAAKRLRSPTIITALSFQFVEWCKATNKPLNMERIALWQSQFRASRRVAPANAYAKMAPAELKERTEKLTKRLAKMQQALDAQTLVSIAPAKRRGRPLGSHNKVK